MEAIAPEAAVLEVDVHHHLRDLLRRGLLPPWPHHLTLARLVMRALRTGQGALIQVEGHGWHQGHYRLAYLAAALLWPGPVVIVAPPAGRQILLHRDLPRLQAVFPVTKPIYCWEQGLRPAGDGIVCVSPQDWLQDAQADSPQLAGRPVIIEGADDLETWLQDTLTVTLHPQDWDALVWAVPDHAESIRHVQLGLEQALLSHPPNPLEAWQLAEHEATLLQHLRGLGPAGSPWAALEARLVDPDVCLWATLERRTGAMTLRATPLDLAAHWAPRWPGQPLVLLGEALGLERDPNHLRQRLGLPPLTPVRFAAATPIDGLHLYLPDTVPSPNTPQFGAALRQELYRLLSLSWTGPVVLLVSDRPLQGQLAASLAAEFGSRVQREKTCLEENTILVSSWAFWLAHHPVLTHPALLVIPTLPLPTLEDPGVAAQVVRLKRLRRDWFHQLLLPVALQTLQRAVSPLRPHQGWVALLDRRVLHRSYGTQVLATLEPLITTHRQLPQEEMWDSHALS
ncbi:MAG: ATP-dependent DNA helicase [Gloeomargaritaceae cyanobacterium C42_A2020_066]|nr:ATP-dependent DNA helicase [Gloeomargaritaceae cyanobacterium C42_A2020_066]